MRCSGSTCIAWGWLPGWGGREHDTLLLSTSVMLLTVTTNQQVVLDGTPVMFVPVMSLLRSHYTSKAYSYVHVHCIYGKRVTLSIKAANVICIYRLQKTVKL